jgi:hypothetical protein
MNISESEKKAILSLHYKNEFARTQSENLLEIFSNILNEQMTVYYYDSKGKFGEDVKGQIPTGGIDAKYVFPNQPYQKNSFPTTIDQNTLRQGSDYQKTNQQNQSQKNSYNQSGQQFQKSAEATKQVYTACKSNPKSDYVLFKQGGFKYLCHTNFCNNHREQKYDPEKKLCENNTLAAKISELGWDGFFKEFREAMNSVVGVGAQVILDSFGVGGILVEVAWGLLLAWDIKQWKDTGEADWINILTDLAGVITFGPGAKIVSSAFKASSITKGTYSVVVDFIKANPSAFKWLTYANFTSLFEYMVLKLGKLALELKFLEPIIVYLKGLLTSLTGIIKAAGGEVVAAATKKMVTKVGGEVVKSGVDYIADKVYDNSSNQIKTADKASKVFKAVSQVSS